MLGMVTSEKIRLSKSVVSGITVGDAMEGYVEGGVVRYFVVREAVVDCKWESADGFSVDGRVFNPRRACAARVTVVGSVCLGVHASTHPSIVCSSRKRHHLLHG